MAPAPTKRPAPVNDDDRKAEAARRASEIAARVGRNTKGAASPAPAPPPDPNSTEGKLAAVLAKINADKARWETNHTKSQSSTTPSLTAGLTPSKQPEPKGPLSLAEIRARTAAATSSTPATNGLSGLAAIKARLEAAKHKSSEEAPRDHVVTPDDAPPQRPPAPKPGVGFQAPTLTTESKEPVKEPGRGGLSTALHPSLLKTKGQKGKEKEAQDEGDGEGSTEATPKPIFKEGENPYMIDWSQYPGWKQPARKSRGTLTITHSLFHRPIMERENKRREAEALKSITKEVEKQNEVLSEEDIELRAFAVQEPPEVEWWDQSFTDQDVDVNESLNDLVTQPILIEGPRKKLERKPFVLPLTAKEHKRKRRLRRAADHQEVTEKLRLGLEAPPPPKLTRQNFMRVMADEAIKNPTYVDTLVTQQIEERKTTHEDANASRKLSKEDRQAKVKANAERNAKMGLRQLVFRVLVGSEMPYKMVTKHKFLLQKNAEEWHDLTGLCIVLPRFSILIIEGGEKSTRAYKHLVTNRIKWAQIIVDSDDVANNEELAKKIYVPHEEEKDGSCKMLFEGEIRKRSFKKWGGVRDCESEAYARASMEKFGMENFLGMALAGLEKDVNDRNELNKMTGHGAGTSLAEQGKTRGLKEDIEDGEEIDGVEDGEAMDE